MNIKTTDLTRIVMSVRSDKEHLVLNTEQGVITIKLVPLTKVRTQVVIQAPREVRILRVPMTIDAEEATLGNTL